jgi:endoglycosylceramidase
MVRSFEPAWWVRVLLAFVAAVVGPGCDNGDAVRVDDADGGGDVDDADDGDGDAAVPLPPPLTDELGRSVFYVGVNLGGTSKDPPDFLPEMDDADDAFLERSGATVARVLIFWEALEPERGTFDDAYLATLLPLLDRLEALGIDAILDMHQDIFGRGFGYSGAPRWACDAANYASFTPMEPWFMNYFSTEVETCFDDLWNDRSLWDDYRDAWAHAVAVLGDHPAVVGFDLMNEPFPGNIDGAAFERDYLAAFYAHVRAAFAGAAAAARILVEPSVVYDFAPHTSLPVFTAGEAFAPHYYPTFIGAGNYLGNETTVADAIADMVRDGARLGGPLIAGEFGIANNVPDAPPYVAAMIDGLLAGGASAVVWAFGRGGPGSFDLLDLDGLPYPVAASLRRPYVHRLAGRLRSTSYDRATRTLDVTWEETGIAAPTVFVVPTDTDCPTYEISSTSDAEGTWSVAAGEHSRWAALTVSPDIVVHSFRVVHPCPDAAP